MTKAISAISRLIARLTQRPQSEEQKLEELLSRTIPFLIRERELITTSREKIRLWGDVVEDYSVLHRIPEKAIEYGEMFGLKIKDTPIMGTHTAAYVEQFSERLLQIIKEHDKKDLGLKTTGLSIKFSDFVYPEEGIRWQLEEPKESTFVLPITGNVNGREVADARIKIGLCYKSPKELIEEPVYSRNKFVLDEERLRDTYKCIPPANREKVPQMLPNAFVISTLFSLLREKTGRMKGVYATMNFDYMAEPELNQDVSVQILPSRKPRETKNKENGNTQYMYKISAVCNQNGKQITRGEVLVTTPYLIDLTKPSHPKQ